MNFVCAIKHTGIGYGIRRRCWQAAILALNYMNEFYWLNVPKEGRHEQNTPVRLLGPDKTYDLQPEDITAVDWAAI